MPKWLKATYGLGGFAAVAALVFLPTWIAIVLIIAGVAVGSFYKAKDRRAVTQGNAARLGFTYVGGGTYESVGPFRLLGHPYISGVTLDNLSRGRYRGLDVSLVDHTHDFNDFTSAVFRAPGLDLPHFAVHPPTRPGPNDTTVLLGSNTSISLLLRLANPFEFVEQPDFERNYLASADEPMAREVFTPALLERLGREPGWYLEGLGDRLLAMKTKPGKNDLSTFLTPDETERFLDDAVELFHLVADRRGWRPARD